MKLYPLLLLAFSTVSGDTVGSPVLPLDEAIERLESYGLIQAPTEQSNNGTELVWHVRKLMNDDESIHDFPWIINILMRGQDDNRIPVSCLRPFVEAGASICGNGEVTPLSLAAVDGNWPAMRYLIDNGANVREQYDGSLLSDIIIGDYKTQLSPEAEAIILDILQKGYEPQQDDLNELAEHHGTADIMLRLIKAGLPVTEETFTKALDGMNANVLELLLNNGYVKISHSTQAEETEEEPNTLVIKSDNLIILQHIIKAVNSKSHFPKHALEASILKTLRISEIQQLAEEQELAFNLANSEIRARFSHSFLQQLDAIMPPTNVADEPEDDESEYEESEEEEEEY